MKLCEYTEDKDKKKTGNKQRNSFTKSLITYHKKKLGAKNSEQLEYRDNKIENYQQVQVLVYNTW